MRVILHNFQDGANDLLDGVQVDDADRLREIFDELQQRDPFILELEGDNGYRLTVGIGGAVSCIQYASSDGEPPYLVAIAKSSESRTDSATHVFLCGGQATEIPVGRCVPFGVLRSVASYFIDTGERSQEVEWVEI